jgi:hypothetical protein
MGAVRSVGLHYPDTKWDLVLNERVSLEVVQGKQLELTVFK